MSKIKEHHDDEYFCMEIWRAIQKYWKWQKKNHVNHGEAVWVLDGKTFKRIGYIKKSLLKKIVEQLPAKDQKLFDEI